MKKFLQYVLFIFILLISLGVATDNLFSALLLALSGALILPSVRNRMHSYGFGHPLFTALLIIAVFLFAMNRSEKAGEQKVIAEEQEKYEKQHSAREDFKKKWEETFRKNPDGILKEVDLLINEGAYSRAQDILSYLSELESQDVAALDQKIINKLEEKRALLESRRVSEQKILEEQLYANSWNVYRDRSKMDDSPTISVSKESINSVPAWLRNVTPRLYIRCSENTTDILIEAGTNFTPVYGEYDKANIRYRIDDKKAVTQLWNESTDGEAAFAPLAISLARSLKGAKKISIEFYPFNAAPAIVEFDLRGLHSHLSEVAKTCKWPL